MGTRKLRLYVVAYLRGLLKPYYDQGALSVVREEMILKALSEELDLEAAKQIHQLEAAMASHVNDKSGFYTKLYDKIIDFRYKLEHDHESNAFNDSDDEIERLTNDPEINKLINTVQKMVDSGEWDEAQKEMTADIEKDYEQLEKREANPFKENPEQQDLIWQWGSSKEHPGDPRDG